MERQRAWPNVASYLELLGLDQSPIGEIWKTMPSPTFRSLVSAPFVARGVIASALGGAALLSMLEPAEAAPGVSAYDGRVSFGAFWTESNGTAGPLGMSDDGRYILYYTYANNVATEDPFRQADVYWYDMVWGINLLVSYSATTWLAGDGTIGDILHRDRMVSPDGRYVMFSSSSTDLVSGDTNDATDVFVGDMYGFGFTKRVSLNNGNQISGESLALGMSNDALKILFATEVSLTATDTNETWDVYLYDRTTGVNETKLVSANAAGAAVGSTLGVISETGRYVAFLTEGALHAADTNLENDVYLKDLSTPTAAPKFVSVGMGGAMPEGIVGHLTMTPDAKFVAFDSNAANIVSGDTNGTVDVFVRNIATNTVVRASTAAGFAQHPEPLCDSFTLSGDGRYVAMSCEGSGLVPEDTNEISDVFSKDLSTGAITLISRAANGAAGNDVSGGPMISRNGTWITFGSFASNLIPYDANAAGDVFRATRQ